MAANEETAAAGADTAVSVPVAWASQSQLLLTAEKDSVYERRMILEDHVLPLAEHVLGARSAAGLLPELRLLSRLLYTLCTWGAGRPSLGEESVHCFPVEPVDREGTAKSEGDQRYSKLSAAMCVALLALDVLVPYLRERWATAAGSAEWCMARAVDMNEAWFLLRGQYPSLAHRLTGVRIMSSPGPAHAQVQYSALGLLALVRVVVMLGRGCLAALLNRVAQVRASREEVNARESGGNRGRDRGRGRGRGCGRGHGCGRRRRRRPDEQQKQEEVDNEADTASAGQEAQAVSTMRCPLCIGACVSPSCLPCGHVMCWGCALAALAAQGRCPTCRRDVHPSSVRQLHNCP